MIPAPTPRLETSKTGLKVLRVYYTGDDFDHDIENAERYFGLVGVRGVTVIAIPVSICNDNYRLGGGLDCNPNYNHRPLK